MFDRFWLLLTLSVPSQQSAPDSLHHGTFEPQFFAHELLHNKL